MINDPELPLPLVVKWAHLPDGRRFLRIDLTLEGETVVGVDVMSGDLPQYIEALPHALRALSDSALRKQGKLP